jgi:hypothetical protein
LPQDRHVHTNISVHTYMAKGNASEKKEKKKPKKDGKKK